MKPSGIEPATVRLVAQCLNQLRHLLPDYDMYECINWRVTFWNHIYRGKGSASVCSKHTAKSFHKYPFTSVGSTKYSSGSGQKEVEWKSSERESNASCRDSPASRKLRHPNVPVSQRVLFSIFLSTWFHLCQVSGFTDRLFPFLPMSTRCVQVLRSPKEAFAAAMQSWCERCEKCYVYRVITLRNYCIFSFLCWVVLS